MALIKRLAMRRKIRGVSEEELAANPLFTSETAGAAARAATTATSVGAAACCAGAANTCSGRAP